MNLGELIVELSLDSTQFTKELDKVKQISTASIKNLEKSLGKGFNLKINTSSLDKLNKSLENTLNKYNAVNKYFKENPIVVSVDRTQVDDLSKSLTSIKRKVNIKTEISGTSKKESINAGEAVADGFIEGAETIKTKKTKVVNDFKEIINDIKDVYSISSPSKVMRTIGLDVGKGFEDGVVTSMLLASQRISEVYEKTLDKIVKNPKATQTQKQFAKNLQGEVQRELESYASLAKEHKMPFPEKHKQSTKHVLNKTEKIKVLAQANKQQQQPIVANEVRQAKAANHTIKTIFNDVTDISKDAVNALQQYSTRISSISHTNINQVKDASETELSSFIKELESMGFEAAKATKSNKTTKRKTKAPDTNLSGINTIGQNVLDGLDSGLKDVDKVANKSANTFIKGFKKPLGINSPSILMMEMGLMIATGLFLGMQKGDSKVAEGARKIVNTLSNTLKPIKEKADPVLGAAGAIPGLSSFSTYGSATLSAADSGLKVLSKVGERHEANPDEILLQSIIGSMKDLVDSIKSDETLTNPREAFEHLINITKAGALGLGFGTDSSVITSIDAAQAGATALFRNSAVGKAYNNARAQTREKLESDPSLDYSKTFQTALIDNFKDLKLDQAELWKALGSFLKVVPTGIGTTANSNLSTLGEILSNAPDAVTPVVDVYKEIKKKKSQKKSTKDAVVSTLTEAGLPSPVADIVGSAANKFSPQIKNLVTTGKNINEGLSKGILNTTTLVTSAIESTGNAVQKQIRKNMGIESPSRVMMNMGSMISLGLSIGINKGTNGVKESANELTNGLIDDVKDTLRIQSPSILMMEIGLMIASGLFLGMQKGDSKVAEGARKIVNTLSNTLKPIKEIADPVLEVAGTITPLSSFSTYGGAALNAAESGLEILSSVGERHEANPDEILFQSIIGSMKDLVDSITSDQTLTKPRKAFEHLMNITKAGALGLGFGEDSSVISSIDAAQDGATALLRNSAVVKAFFKSFTQTTKKIKSDPSLKFSDTFQAALTDNFKDLKLNKEELLKAFKSAMKVTKAGALGLGFDSDSLVVNLIKIAQVGAPALVKNSEIAIAAKKSFAQTTEKTKSDPSLNFSDTFQSILSNNLKDLKLDKKEITKAFGHALKLLPTIIDTAIDSELLTLAETFINAPDAVTPVTDVVGSTANKFKPQFKTLVATGKNINEGLSKGILTTTTLVTSAIESTGNAVQKQIRKNMGIDSPSKVMMNIGSMISLGLSIGINKGTNGVKESVNMLANGLIDDVKDTLQIQSPSKIMEWIGLNFGKGFEVGAIASLALSSKRISDAYKDVVEAIVNDPHVSQSTKQALEATKNEIEKDLQQFAEDYRNNKFASDADAIQGVEQIYLKAQGQAASVSSYQNIDVQSIHQGALKDVQESQENNYANILGNLFDSFAKQDLRRFVMNLEKAFDPFQNFITFDIANLFGYFQNMVNGAIHYLRQLRDTIIQIELLQRKLDFLGGSKAAGAKEMQYGIGVSRSFGVDAEPAINAYGSLAVAAKGTQLEGDGVRELFEGISAAIATLGLTGQNAELVFMAFTQMLAKGKISMEELRQQLGEKFPPAMQLFATAIGKSVPEMIDLVSKGALLSEEVLPKVAKQLKLDYGNSITGANGLSVALSRLGTVGFDMSVKLTNAYSSLFAGVVNIFTSMADVVNTNLDIIIKVANSFMISIAGLLGVGLINILKFPAVSGTIAKAGMLIGTGMGAAIAGLSPYFLGAIADVVANWLGAQNSIMENMYSGVSNMISMLIDLVDNTKMHFSGTGLFDVILGDTSEEFNLIKAVVNSISDLFKNLFGFLKPGMIEMAALVLMFHQLRTLANQFVGPILLAGREAFSNLAIAAKNALSPITGIFSANSTVRASALKNMVGSLGLMLKNLSTLALEVGLALAVMFLAKSDFSNPIETAINKASKSINGSLLSIENSFIKMNEAMKKSGKEAVATGNKIKSLADSIPSKGLQLDITYVLGMKDTGYTTDDFMKQVNKGLAGEIDLKDLNFFERREVNITRKLRQAGYEQRPEFTKKQLETIGKYPELKSLSRETDQFLPKGVADVIDSIGLMDKNLETFKTRLTDLGLLDQVKYAEKMQNTVSKIAEIDQKRLALSLEYNKIASEDPDSEKSVKRRGEIAKELRKLNDERKKQAKPIEQESVSNIQKELSELKKLDLSSYGPGIQTLVQSRIQELENLVNLANKVIKKTIPEDVFQSIFMATTGALKRFELVFERFGKSIESASAKRQYLIYSNQTTPGNIEFASKQSSIIEAEDKLLGALAQYQVQQKAFALLSLVPESQQDETTKNELEQTRKNKISAETEVNNAKANLAKSRYDLNRSVIEQNRQIEEFIRNAEKEVLGVKTEFEKASLDLKMMKMKTRVSESLIGVVDDGVASFINNVVSVFDEINNAVKQQIDAETKITELGFRKQEIELENERFRESLPSSDMMDLLVKTRADIKQVTTAFAEENKKFDDISKNIIKQGANLASGVKNTNIEAQKLTASLQQVLTFTKSIDVSTMNFKNNLQEATKLLKGIDKSLGQNTSTNNPGKPVADSMQGANKNSAQMAQNVNNLTSPVNTIVGAVLRMRDAFKDSSSYTAQISANLNNTDTNKGNKPPIPGNTPLPISRQNTSKASNSSQNEYAINYGGDLLASAGVSDVSDVSGLIPLQPTGSLQLAGLPNWLPEWLGGGTLEQKLERFKTKDRRKYASAEKLIDSVVNAIPLIMHLKPNIGEDLVGADYEYLTQSQRYEKISNLVNSAYGSDLHIIKNLPKAMVAVQTLEQLAQQSETPERDRKIEAVNAYMNTLYKHINEPKDFSQIEATLGPEFKQNQQNQQKLQIQLQKEKLPNTSQLQELKQRATLKLLEEPNRNLAQVWLDKATRSKRPGKATYLTYYKLQEDLKTGKRRNAIDFTPSQPSQPVPPVQVSKPDPKPRIVQVPKPDPKPGTVQVPKPDPKPRTVQIPKDPKIESLDTTRQTIETNSQIASETVQQKINNFRAEMEKTSQNLQSASVNRGGVSNDVLQLINKARELGVKFTPNPATQTEDTYQSDLAEIKKQELEFKTQIKNTQSDLKALRERLTELPNNIKILRSDANKIQDPKQRQNLLKLIDTLEKDTRNTYEQLIKQKETDLKELENSQKQFKKSLPNLQAGAATIRKIATTKDDAELEIFQLTRKIDTNKLKIDEIKQTPGYDFSEKLQKDVIKLEYENEKNDATIKKLQEQIKFLEDSRSNPKIQAKKAEFEAGIEKTYNIRIKLAESTQQQKLLALPDLAAETLAKNKLLASITQPNQYRDSLMDIEQFRQDKTKEIKASSFFAQREQKDDKDKPTTEAIKQMEEFEKALADLNKEIDRRTKDLEDKEKNRVLNLLSEARIARLEENKNMHGDVFANNIEIRRLRQLEAERRRDETIRNIAPLGENASLTERDRHTNELQAAKERYDNEILSIQRSYEDLGSALRNAGVSTGLQNLKDGLTDIVMNDLIIGFDGVTGKTKDLSNELRGFERVLYNVAKAVLNVMTKIAIEAAVNKLFGKGGWLDIGRIFGAAQGGIVPNYAEGGVAGINKAIQRERSQNGGKQPVLAVLTPGERVLTVAENKRFEALQLEKFLQPTTVMPEEMAYRKINNYAFGGVIGMNPVPMGGYAQGQSDNSTTINIPVTVENNGNSNDSQLDTNSLQNVVRSAVLTEIQRQQRQGGILRR